MEDRKRPTSRPHGAELRGLAEVPRSTLHEGRFGRMFRNLPPFAPADEDLVALAQEMIEPPEDDQGDETAGDNDNISAGFTYFGQFIDHDITFDPTSKLQRDNDPNALRDFRTPRFDLDSVYADGPADNPFLYQDDGVHLLIGRNKANEEDLPRNVAGRALIGDPRNDENLIVSQLHLAFLKYHNKVVDSLPADTPNRFDEARRIVRWHYQWLVIHRFLTLVVGSEVVKDILKTEPFLVGVKDGVREATAAKVDLKFFKWKHQPFMPVEFSVAAYRFGHSMVRGDYALNKATSGDNELPIFAEDPQPDLRGFRERPKGLVIEWPRFFKFPDSSLELQPTRKIDTKLAFSLSILPKIEIGAADNIRALAERNLRRGKALGLPSGQAVARAMGIPRELILRGGALGLKPALAPKFGENTPLWFYILKEAEVQCQGKKLGPVGGRIVAEVLIGLLYGDPMSYLRVEPTWHPEPNQFGAGPDGQFRMADFLRFATVA